MNRDLAVGTRVTLSPNSSWAQHSGGEDPMNPVGVEGVVTMVSTWVSVEWDRYNTNSYRGYDSDLIPVVKISNFSSYDEAKEACPEGMVIVDMGEDHPNRWNITVEEV